MNRLNALRNRLPTPPREVTFGILSGACVLAALLKGGFHCKNWLCYNIDKEDMPWAMTFMGVHAGLYSIASYLQYDKTHHIPFFMWQVLKALLLVGLTFVSASQPNDPIHYLHQPLAFGYILMSFLSCPFWCWVNQHDISPCLAWRVLGMYFTALCLYVTGCLYSYALTGTMADAFYY